MHLRSATADELALLAEVDAARMPVHLAVIMDGNRRWARSRNLPALAGHRAGERAFRDIVRACSDLGIKILTSYAFSLENWKRSSHEVGILMQMFEHYSRRRRKEMDENKVRFRVIGALEELPPRVREELERTVDLTAANDGLTLNLAVNYGARSEILRAVKNISQEVAGGRLRAEDIDEQTMASHLYTSQCPDPDLLIRTSGEMRISNFLLWQSAYTEFWFTDRFWPEFTRTDLLRAIIDFQSRERRFGGSAREPVEVHA